MQYRIYALCLLVSGCVTEVVTPPPQRPPPPPPPPQQAVVLPEAAQEYAPPPVVSVYVEPPVEQPAPIAVPWAPPPMLVETPPPPPTPAAVWVGGYWAWQGTWVWAHAHWVGPPRPNYGYINPYYENRNGAVIFIPGFWSPPGVMFVPPAPGLHISVEIAGPGVIPGPRPIGPEGVFVPPPPGSRFGMIIPAPIGTSPAVVTSAPPVVAVGMRVTVNNTNVTNVSNVHNTTVINNVTTNITNVTIVAPPTATANHQAVNAQVPAQAHLAAALPPVVKAQAPEPASTKPLQAYRPGQGAVALPPAQKVIVNPPRPVEAARVTSPPAPPPKANEVPPKPNEVRAKPNEVTATHAAETSKPAVAPAPRPEVAHDKVSPPPVAHEPVKPPAAPKTLLSKAPEKKPPVDSENKKAAAKEKTAEPAVISKSKPDAAEKSKQDKPAKPVAKAKTKEEEKDEKEKKERPVQ